MEQKTVVNIPIDGLPTKVQKLANEMAEVYQCSRDLVVAVILLICGMATGKRVTVTDGKFENLLNLWVCIVGCSGSNKSAPVKKLLMPVRDINTELQHQFEETLKAWKKDECEMPEPPSELLLSDETYEAICVALSNADDNGLLLHSDELMSFFSGMKSSASSALMSIYDNNSFTVGRKKSKRMRLEKPSLSIVGSIQPDLLSKLFSGSRSGVSGIVQRWCMVIVDKKPLQYSNKVLSDETFAEWETLVEKLFFVSGAIRIDDDAKAIYAKYFNKLNEKMMKSGEHMSSVYSKLLIIVERIAGIVHVMKHYEDMNYNTTTMEPETMEYAVRVADYFESTAIKVCENLKISKIVSKEQIIKNMLKAYPDVDVRKLAESIGTSATWIYKCRKGNGS
ncbi:MAG: DUF3987 domain-containing protein [Bacteroidaceae bacterium]|nr:DUF3987 domain-containing protein [Bacteroidaceae bacterium]